MALAAVVMDRGSIRGFKEDAIAKDLVREIARLATRLPRRGMSNRDGCMLPRVNLLTEAELAIRRIIEPRFRL